MTALPTRKLEAYRYADIDALASVWSALAPPERIDIAAQQSVQQIWLPSEDAVQVRRAEIVLAEGGSAHIFALNTAAEYGRIELDVTLADGADFALNAANIGAGSSNLEIVTTVRHIGVAATSRQTVRSVLGGKAVGTYLGKVAVARDAQRTDSEQSVKAMLLTRGAMANCKPELEIFADDVKCAHGASVGELDADMLFYAASRGLDPASARALLLEGFVMGLWDSIQGDDRGIADAARSALRAAA
ncbi:SufD family Fe-S cluster assembly protein [Sphingomonas sp.]|uniref:SufD family Fe-S cluster assembly protein n=1 Tax=Sphingomonas sp. TaxID=28214 RepID=UPI00286DE5CF|nr:SufD family Fe-S cluster assembly protein [Sphingomonas sp.]